MCRRNVVCTVLSSLFKNAQSRTIEDPTSILLGNKYNKTGVAFLQCFINVYMYIKMESREKVRNALK